MTVDVYAFHKKGLKPLIKKTMSFGEFHKLKSKDYYFRAYQINFNVTIL